MTPTPRRHTHPRSCWWCAHFQQRHGTAAVCAHPAYRVPTPWQDAIQAGQPCGGANAPLWEVRHA